MGCNRHADGVLCIKISLTLDSLFPCASHSTGWYVSPTNTASRRPLQSPDSPTGKHKQNIGLFPNFHHRIFPDTRLEEQPILVLPELLSRFFWSSALTWSSQLTHLASSLWPASRVEMCVKQWSCNSNRYIWPLQQRVEKTFTTSKHTQTHVYTHAHTHTHTYTHHSHAPQHTLWLTLDQCMGVEAASLIWVACKTDQQAKDSHRTTS